MFKWCLGRLHGQGSGCCTLDVAEAAKVIIFLKISHRQTPKSSSPEHILDSAGTITATHERH